MLSNDANIVMLRLDILCLTHKHAAIYTTHFMFRALYKDEHRKHQAQPRRAFIIHKAEPAKKREE